MTLRVNAVTRSHWVFLISFVHLHMYALENSAWTRFFRCTPRHRPSPVHMAQDSMQKTAPAHTQPNIHALQTHHQAHLYSTIWTTCTAERAKPFHLDPSQASAFCFTSRRFVLQALTRAHRLLAAYPVKGAGTRRVHVAD